MSADTPKKPPSLNKGNWSELYAFLKILSDRKLKLADKDLNAIPNKMFGVRQVLRADNETLRAYDVMSSENVVTSCMDLATQKKTTNEIDRSEVDAAVPILLNLVKNGSGYFKLPEMDSLLELLNYGTISAKSENKGDIRIVIHDYVTNLPNEVDFSIKSFIGAAPTLLNAGKTSTNMLFKVKGPVLNVEEINNVAGHAKVKKRFAAIEECGASLEFHRMLSSNFQKNLRKIDSLMPIFLGEYVRAYYTTKATTLPELTKEVATSNRIINLLDVPFTEEDIKYKIKQLLISSALGMVPQTDWDGLFQADGGYIIVKEDGDMVCFHIYNIAQLGEYLFENTKFDTPSTKPNKFNHAFLFEEDSQQYFQINFQIRFI